MCRHLASIFSSVASRQLGFFCYVMFLLLSCKLKTFSNFANSDFSVFLHESAQLVAFETILRIYKICKLANFFCFSPHWYIWQFLGLFCKFWKFGKLEFFRISQRVGTLSDVWGQFVNFRNLQQFTSFFFQRIFFILTDEIYAKIVV